MDPDLNILQTGALRQNNTRPIVYMPKLSNTVPFQIKQKIWSAKFIEIKELLQLNTQSHIESTRLTIQTSEDGLPILVQVPTKKKPVSFKEYQAGWRVYKAVYLEKYPTEVQALLMYEMIFPHLPAAVRDWIGLVMMKHSGKGGKWIDILGTQYDQT